MGITMPLSKLHWSLALAATTLAVGGVAVNTPFLRQNAGTSTTSTTTTSSRQLSVSASEQHVYSAYKTSWPECAMHGQELSGEQCKTHIERDIQKHGHVLQGHVDVVLQSPNDEAKVDEVLIQVNRHGEVIGSGSGATAIHDGWVRYEFLWNGANVGPFNCIGHVFASCCDEIRAQTKIDDTLGKFIGCHRQVVYPAAVVDASLAGDNSIYFSEYVFNRAKHDVQMIYHVQDPKDVTMELEIQEGADGKVHTVPTLDLQVIHQHESETETESEPVEQEQDSASEVDEDSASDSGDSMNGSGMASNLAAFVTSTSATEALTQSVSGGEGATSGAEAFVKGATSSISAWWYGVPLGFLTFSMCFCCTALYVLCCIPIKDEDYLKDTEKVLEEVSEKHLSVTDRGASPGPVSNSSSNSSGGDKRGAMNGRQTASSSRIM